MGNDQGDAAEGESAAQLGHGIGRGSEQILSSCTLAAGLFSPVSLQMDCNILCAKCPRIILPLRQPWENVLSKHRRISSSFCLPMTTTPRRINSWIVDNLGKNIVGTRRNLKPGHSHSTAVLYRIVHNDFDFKKL